VREVPARLRGQATNGLPAFGEARGRVQVPGEDLTGKMLAFFRPLLAGGGQLWEHSAHSDAERPESL
jgi:hypothetical protein